MPRIRTGWGEGVVVIAGGNVPAAEPEKGVHRGGQQDMQCGNCRIRRIDAAGELGPHALAQVGGDELPQLPRKMCSRLRARLRSWDGNDHCIRYIVEVACGNNFPTKTKNRPEAASGHPC